MLSPEIQQVRSTLDMRTWIAGLRLSVRMASRVDRYRLGEVDPDELLPCTAKACNFASHRRVTLPCPFYSPSASVTARTVSDEYSLQKTNDFDPFGHKLFSFDRIKLLNNNSESYSWFLTRYPL